MMMVGTNQFPMMAMNNKQIVHQGSKAGCFHCLRIFDVSEIKNYTELAALALQVDAAPNSHSYEYVLNGFKAELMKRLLKDGVDADSVFGNVFVDWEKFNPSIKAS